MQAVILAAGTGSRLGRRRPKCLAQVGGRTLLQHQLDGLAQVGVSSVLVVVGYQQDMIRRSVDASVEFAVNDAYADTNSLYSFLQARSWVREDLLVLNADVLVHPTVLSRLASGPDDAIAYDSDSGHDPEHMKVQLRAGRLRRMAKDLPPASTHGENLGIVRLSRSAGQEAFAAADRLVRNGHRRSWLASAVNRVAANRRVAAVDVAGVPWVEIDFPADLQRARRTVWPAIADDLSLAA